MFFLVSLNGALDSGSWASRLNRARKQAKPAPNFFYHSVSGYYTAVLTARLLSPVLFPKLNHG